MNIAKRLTLVRQSKGLTIADVSSRIGKGTYDRWETGRIIPKFDDLLEICKVLDIKIWELVAEELVLKFKE